MDRVLCIPLGIIVERSRIESAWQTYAWRASGILLGPSHMQAGSPLWRDEDVATFFAGPATLSLHPTDAPSYRENLNQEVPQLYIVLAARETAREGEPPDVHFVTAAPDEAQSYLDGDATQVERVAMPKPLANLVAAYLDQHDRPPPREERRRPVSFNRPRLSGGPG